MVEIRKIGSATLRLKALIYGGFGVGKTYLASTCARHPEMSPALLVNIEGGTVTASNVEAMDETEQLFTTADIEKIFWDLANEKENVLKYRTVVVDSGSALQSMSLAEVARANAKGNKSEMRLSQQDYGDSTIRVLDLLKRFRNLDKNVIVTAGVREEFDTDNPHDRRRRGPCFVGPDFTPTLARKLMHVFDHVWMLKADDAGVRHLLTQPVTPYMAKTRGKEFSEAIGKSVKNPDLAGLFDLFLKTQAQKGE